MCVGVERGVAVVGGVGGVWWLLVEEQRHSV